MFVESVDPDSDPSPPKRTNIIHPQTRHLAMAVLSGMDMEEAEWKMSANCQGMDPRIFWSEERGPNNIAKAICRACVVEEQCLELSLRLPENGGVWGGTGKIERGRIRKARRLTES